MPTSREDIQRYASEACFRAGLRDTPRNRMGILIGNSEMYQKLPQYHTPDSRKTYRMLKREIRAIKRQVKFS